VPDAGLMRTRWAVSGSRLLQTDRAATLQSGSPPGLGPATLRCSLGGRGRIVEALPACRSPMQRYRTPGLGSGGLESELFDGFLGLVIQLIVS
jgi:hypothetical protein